MSSLGGLNWQEISPRLGILQLQISRMLTAARTRDAPTDLHLRRAALINEAPHGCRFTRDERRFFPGSEQKQAFQTWSTDGRPSRSDVFSLP